MTQIHITTEDFDEVLDSEVVLLPGENLASISDSDLIERAIVASDRNPQGYAVTGFVVSRPDTGVILIIPKPEYG